MQGPASCSGFLSPQAQAQFQEFGNNIAEFVNEVFSNIARHSSFWYEPLFFSALSLAFTVDWEFGIPIVILSIAAIIGNLVAKILSEKNS